MAGGVSTLTEKQAVVVDVDDDARGWTIRDYFIQMARLERRLGRPSIPQRTPTMIENVMPGDHLRVNVLDETNRIDSHSADV